MKTNPIIKKIEIIDNIECKCSIGKAVKRHTSNCKYMNETFHNETFKPNQLT